MPKVVTTEEIIARSVAAWGDKYTYSKLVYVNSKTKVTVTCPEHGDFSLLPVSHTMNGCGCPTCHQIPRHMSKADFVAEAVATHGAKFDYSATVYTGMCNKIDIRCAEHGIFSQFANSHVQGAGCPYCSNLGRRDSSYYVEAFQKKHGDLYDYSHVQYLNSREKVAIRCYAHGMFYQLVGNHLKGQGCPLCKTFGYSAVAVMWLEYRAQQDGTFIQHANNGGERCFRFSNGQLIFVDGFSEEHNHAYEFLGGKHLSPQLC